MKKISVFITAVLMMSFIIIPTNSVQAMGSVQDTVMEEIIKNVEQTNKQINEEIEKAVYAAQEAFDDYNHDLMVLANDKNNVSNEKHEQIQQLEENYIVEINKIVNDLIKVTNKMAAKMIEDAAKEGVTVYCEWVVVTIDGKPVLVDPLRVGNH